MINGKCASRLEYFLLSRKSLCDVWQIEFWLWLLKLLIQWDRVPKNALPKNTWARKSLKFKNMPIWNFWVKNNFLQCMLTRTNTTSSQFFYFDIASMTKFACAPGAFSATSGQVSMDFMRICKRQCFLESAHILFVQRAEQEKKWLEFKKKRRKSAGWGSSPCILRHPISLH